MPATASAAAAITIDVLRIETPLKNGFPGLPRGAAKLAPVVVARGGHAAPFRDLAHSSSIADRHRGSRG
jgi:hypothetical protein